MMLFSCLVCFKIGLKISQVHTLALHAVLPVGYQSGKTDHRFIPYQFLSTSQLQQQLECILPSGYLPTWIALCCMYVRSSHCFVFLGDFFKVQVGPRARNVI